MGKTLTHLHLLMLLLLAQWGLGAAPGENARRPLDLPAGIASPSDSEEEDETEVITFFGGSYEGEAFFFLLDKSGSMAGEKIFLLKQELTETISSLGSSSELGLVAYSSDVISFSHRPKLATPSIRSSAIAWVEALVPFGATHMLDGAVMVLATAALSHRNKVVIAVGDGLPNSPGADGTLEGILVHNWQGLPFNTILFGDNAGAVTFMGDLASSTGGSFQNNP